MFKKILVAYEGSENARRALAVAAELAQKLEAELLVVHVLMHGRPSKELMRMAEIEQLVKETHKTAMPGVAYPSGRPVNLLGDSENSDQAARVLAALGDQLVADAKARCRDLGVQTVTTFVRSGDYADEILDTADEEEADLVVIGSRGLGRIRQTILGSVSQKVLYEADQTVVVVK